MQHQPTRLVLILVCLTFGIGLLGVAAPAAAADKKKSWASKKHHKTHHKAGKPKAVGSVGTGTKGAAAAPAEEADEDDGDEAESDDKSDDSKAKPKTAKSPAKSDKNDDDREASDDKSQGDGDDDTVVHRKAKRPVIEEEGGALVALELEAGPRAVHRTFDFNDPLSDHVAGAMKPYSYVLPAGPVPFVTLALYPAAFATHGFAANLGLVASYEKLIGTKTTNGSSFSTLGQQLEVGVRARLPLGQNEVGLTGAYGKHTFHVAETDAGPTGGSTVPNVDYTFVAVGADARLRLSPIEIGAHVGTRFVMKTGSLAENWFNTTKTTSIEGGISLAYRVTPIFAVVAGGDIVRYAFDFNPVPTTSAFVAGGAVDQYLSGFLALRVSLSGG